MQEQSCAARPGISRLRLAGLFLVVALAFVAFRGSSCLVWDDSVSSQRDNRAQTQAEIAADPLGKIAALARAYFGRTRLSGYRPLSSLYWCLSSACLNERLEHSVWQLLFVGAVYGAFAVCFLLVARRFVRREITAWFALLLLFGSPPFVATSWIFITFLQIIMPLIICAALLAYWSWSEQGHIAALAGLGVLLLIGPWCREILFVVPLLIGYLEWERTKRPTWLMGLATFGFAHAVYPTALLKCTLFPDLPLRSMLELGGSVSSEMSSSALRWQAGFCFLPLFPPCLWVLGILSSWVPHFLYKPDAQAKETPSFACASGLCDSAVHVSRVLIAPAVLLAAAVLHWFAFPSSAAMFCLLIAALAWRQGTPFLAAWFLVLFLPMLRVYTEHIHFLYALVPASIILASTTESLWQWLGERSRVVSWVRHAVVAVALLAVADQSLTFVGSHRVMHVTYAGMQKVAARLQDHLQDGDIVICNAISAKEIEYYTGLRYRHYFTVPWGISDPRLCVGERSALLKVLHEPSRPDLYFLDVCFDYMPTKKAHAHKYVHAFEIQKDDLGTLHRTRVRYPFCDPLRHLIPREHLPFLGAPDLVNDFYCGPPRNGRWFCYEVYAAYQLYRVTGRDLMPRLDAPVTLAAEGVDGFNILRIGDEYLAFHQSLSVFDCEKYRRGQYGECLIGSTAEEVRRKILNRASP